MQTYKTLRKQQSLGTLVCCNKYSHVYTEFRDTIATSAMIFFDICKKPIILLQHARRCGSSDDSMSKRVLYVLESFYLRLWQ